ncbi:MAG TPA: hypothetical protein VHF02_09005 [Luteimonas sp.]|nr:hypothetical protein [Luteimonas sp.]
MASLASSNKHLSSAAKRQKAVRLTIATSSAIEGIHTPFKAQKVVARKAAGKAKTPAKPAGLKAARHAKSA